MIEKRVGWLSSSGLHIVAMILMLIDHMGYVLYPDLVVLRWIGRLAFPIFAFMIAEGARRTRSRKIYILRLFILAIISEVPFNLMVSHSVGDIKHQNVVWTLLLGLILIDKLDPAEVKDRPSWLRMISIYFWLIVIPAFAKVFNTDYGLGGVILIIYMYAFLKFFDHRVIYVISSAFVMTTLALLVLNGFMYTVEIGSNRVMIPMQLLWVLSLVFICGYNGNKGISSKWFKWITYFFYPIHMMGLVGFRYIIGG